MFPNSTAAAALKPAICQAKGGFREKYAKRASSGELSALGARGCRPSPAQLSDMRPHELAGGRQRAAAVFEFGIPDRPRVDHVRPDLKRHIDIGGPGGRGQPGGVRQQRLG